MEEKRYTFRAKEPLLRFTSGGFDMHRGLRLLQVAQRAERSGGLFGHSRRDLCEAVGSSAASVMFYFFQTCHVISGITELVNIASSIFSFYLSPRACASSIGIPCANTRGLGTRAATRPTAASLWPRLDRCMRLWVWPELTSWSPKYN